MSDDRYVPKRTRQPKALPGAWLHSLAYLMDAGQASTDDISHKDSGYVAGTIRSALSNMHMAGFVQRCPGKLWGLTKAGIDAALNAEQEAAARDEQTQTELVRQGLLRASNGA